MEAKSVSPPGSRPNCAECGGPLHHHAALQNILAIFGRPLCHSCERRIVEEQKEALRRAARRPE